MKISLDFWGKIIVIKWGYFKLDETLAMQMQERCT